MGVPEKIAELAARLPPEKQAEVLDFVEYLTERSSRRPVVEPGWSDEAFRHLALASLGADEDPVTYELADCREQK